MRLSSLFDKIPGKLGPKIAALIFASIVIIEAAILVPSYSNFKAGLLKNINDLGQAGMVSTIHSHSDVGVDRLLVLSKRLIGKYRILGGVLYDKSTTQVGSFGNLPEITPSHAKPAQISRSSKTRELFYDVIWNASDVGLSYTIVARLNASSVEEELMNFVLRITGLVLLISGFVCGTTMMIVHGVVLARVKSLHDWLEQTEFAKSSTLEGTALIGPDDEIGRMSFELQDMVRRAAASFAENKLIRAELTTTNAGLEDTVKSRTLELQQEAEERRRAEKEALDSSIRFKDFSEAASDWFWEMDENLRFSYFSERFKEITGVVPELLLGKTRQETGIPNVDEAVWNEHLETLAAHHPFKGFEHPRIGEDGSEIWLSISGRPVFDADLNFKGYRGIGRDITSRVLFEKNARISTDRLKTVTNTVPAGIVAFRVDDGELLFANEEAINILGTKVDTVYGAILKAIDEEAKNAGKTAARTVERNSVNTHEVQIAGKSGKPIWISISLATVGNEGENLHVISFGEITERKRAEAALVEAHAELENRVRERTQELQDSENRFRTALENMSGGMFMFSKEFLVEIASPSFARMYQLPEGLVQEGRPVSDIIRYRAERGDFGEGNVEELIERRLEGYHDDQTNIVEEVVPGEMILELVRAPKKNGGYVGVFNDISERKQNERMLVESEERLQMQVHELHDRGNRLEKQAKELIELAEDLSAARDQLSELNARKDNFFAIIAHDLRSPFNALLGFSEVLATTSDRMAPNEIVDYGKLIHRSAEEALKLVEDLLDWSRLQLGRMDIEFRPFNIGELTSLNVKRYELVAEAKNVKLEAGDASEVWAIGDHKMADTVVRNLISNAIKFTQNGGTVTVTSSQNKDRVEMRISDSGVGIPKDKLATLFTLGEKKSTKGTNGETGTGLGLQLCKELIEKQGGEISVESEPGKGSVFMFSLPVANQV